MGESPLGEVSIVDPVATRLARWAERDAAIGMAAEIDELRARLAEREREVADLREHVARQAQRIDQLVIARDRAAAPARRSLARRVAGKAKRTVKRALRSRPRG